MLSKVHVENSQGQYLCCLTAFLIRQYEALFHSSSASPPAQQCLIKLNHYQ